ncbi:MAG: hypothetical protein ACOC93_01430 [Planctomycetota bacterium]
MLRTIVLATLLIVLAGAAGWALWRGLWQWRRRRRLAQAANELGLRFSSQGTDHLPQRYSDLLAIRAGHSPRTDNVNFGRWHGCAVRCFDLRCEAGHGPRRRVRRYRVLALEMPAVMQPLLLYRTARDTPAPIDARASDGLLGQWAYTGQQQLAAAILHALPALDEHGVALQASERLLAITLPLRHSETAWRDCLSRLPQAAQPLQQPRPVSPDSRRREY